MKAPRGAIALLLALLAIVAVAASGCGGDDDKPAAKKTSTPTSTPTAAPTSAGGKPVGKRTIRRVNRARDRLAAACKTLKATADDAAALRDLRVSARTYLTVFDTSPDEPFRRGPNSPLITMRKLLGAVSVYVRDNCGDGGAKAIARRLARAASKKSS